MMLGMQVFSATFVVVLFAAGSSSALRCQHCLFEGCDAQEEESIECSVHTVNRLYNHLAALANLEGLLASPQNAQIFQCFEVVISDGNKNGTVKSCAFAETDICNAWKSDISVESCQVCRDEDHCSLSGPTLAQRSAGLPAGGSAGWLHWIVVALLVIALKIGSIKL